MLNAKEKITNVVPVVVWFVLTAAIPVDWISKNLGSAHTYLVVLNYLVFVGLFAFVFWGMTTYTKTRPREFWRKLFPKAAVLYLFAGIVSWQGWLSLTILILPVMWLVFFVVNERWGHYLDSLTSATRPETAGEPL